MQLGPRLHDARLLAGLSIRTLAQRLGVSPWQVQLVESGRTANPGIAYVWRCAEVCGLSLAELLHNVEPPPPRPRPRPADSGTTIG